MLTRLFEEGTLGVLIYWDVCCLLVGCKNYLFVHGRSCSETKVMRRMESGRMVCWTEIIKGGDVCQTSLRNGKMVTVLSYLEDQNPHNPWMCSTRTALARQSYVLIRDCCLTLEVVGTLLKSLPITGFSFSNCSEIPACM